MLYIGLRLLGTVLYIYALSMFHCNFCNLIRNCSAANVANIESKDSSDPRFRD